jgi:hypothetical protein
VLSFVHMVWCMLHCTGYIVTRLYEHYTGENSVALDSFRCVNSCELWRSTSIHTQWQNVENPLTDCISSPASVGVPHYPLQRFIVKSCRPQFRDCKINYFMLVLVLSVTACGLAGGHQHFI